MDNEELKQLLLETPANIKQEELGLIELKTEHAKNTRRMEELNAPIKADVKMNLSFKNDGQRDIAIDTRLKTIPEYVTLKDNIPDAELNMRKKEIELVYLRDMFRAYIAIAGMGKP